MRNVNDRQKHEEIKMLQDKIDAVLELLDTKSHFDKASGGKVIFTGIIKELLK